MHVEAVTRRGGEVVDRFALPHGADPHLVLKERGRPWLRPLAARADGDETVLTVLVRDRDAPVPTDPRSLSTGIGPRRPKVDPHLPPDAELRIKQRVAAYGIVLSERGVLATAFSHRTAVRGQWGLPGGGIDPGEEPADTVVREVEEETDQHCVVGDLLDVQSDHWVGRSPHGDWEDFHALRLVYAARVESPSQPRVNDVGGTTAAARWVELDRWSDLGWVSGSRALLERHLATV